MLALGMFVAVLGANVGTSAVLAQQDPCASPDPSPDPDPTPDPTVELSSLGEVPECDDGPGPGPRLTPSAAATNTAVPEPTDAPSSPVPASTSTPTGGAGAGGVAPPDTGDGSSISNGISGFVLVAGLLLTLGGGGLVALGARRRI